MPSFARLLTPTLAFTVDSGWLHQNWPVGHTSGFATTDVGLKYEAYRNNQHETLVSVGLAWGIGHSGARRRRSGCIEHGSAGDILRQRVWRSSRFAFWFRPFAITGAIVSQIPFGSGGRALAPSQTTTKFRRGPCPCGRNAHWGFSIQYSTLYLTSRFTGGPPKAEPLNQLVPLVEFSFDSPRKQYTAATMNPGFAYVAVAWQIAAEAVVPLNRAGGMVLVSVRNCCSSLMTCCRRCLGNHC